MRYFSTLEEAASEIKRDIAKSPVVKSSRVQNIIGEHQVHEALDYSYSVAEMPTNRGALIILGKELGFWLSSDMMKIDTWLQRELQVRMYWEPGVITELLHPHLENLVWDSSNQESGILPEVDYAYTDRLRGSLTSVAEHLATTPDSRRGYWPIFQPEDAVRASRSTRIPCSLGYQAIIRYVNDIPNLHLTYMERACDFDKFWLTDIWLARQWQLELLRHIKNRASWPGFNSLICGNTTHFITSLHSFIDSEVY